MSDEKQSNIEQINIGSITTLLDKLNDEKERPTTVRVKESVQEQLNAQARIHKLSLNGYFEKIILDELRNQYGQDGQFLSEQAHLINQTVQRLGEQLISMIQTSRGRVENDRFTISKLTKDYGELNQEHTQLKERMKAWDTYKDKIEKELIEVKEQKEEIQQKLLTVETKHEDILKEQQEKHKEELKDARELVKLKQDRLDQLEKEWTIVENEISQISELKQTIKDREVELEQQKNYYLLEIDKKLIEQERTLQSNYFIQLQEQLQERQKENHVVLTSKDQSILDLEKHILRLQNQLDDHKDKLNTLKEENATLLKKLNNIKKPNV